MSQPQLQRSQHGLNWLRSRLRRGFAITLQAADLRSCVELRGIEPLTSSMPCTRRTVSGVRRRPVEATHVRSYPTATQPRNGAGKTSTVPRVRMRPPPSLGVPLRRGDCDWLRCWLRRRDPPPATCQRSSAVRRASGSAKAVTASTTSPKSAGTSAPSTPGAVRCARYVGPRNSA
jgi:hypothetical protein